MSNPKLFTLIIDYKGGTYVTQANASDVAAAPAECIKKWNLEGIEEIIHEKDKTEIVEQLKEEEFVLINGMNNVWCGTALLRGELMIMNLVETSNAT